MGFIMIILDNIKVQADILLRGMNGKHRRILRLDSKRPTTFIIFEHGDSGEFLWHLFQWELSCPLLLAFLRRFFDELYLFAVFGFLNHANSSVHVTQHIFGKLRILLHLLNDGWKLLHRLWTQLGWHPEVEHLDGRSQFFHECLPGCCGTVTVESSTDTCRMGNLPCDLLHIVWIGRESLLGRDIHCITLSVIMGNACSILADGHKVVTHIEDKLIDADTLRFILLVHVGTFLVFCHTAILLHLFVIVFLMHMGHRGLVDVEQDIDILPRIGFVSSLFRL